MPRVPAHQVTTRNLGAAYPFIAEAGLGRRGVVIGDDLLGGSFVFDPFELYTAGVVSNPNMVVFGQIGRGKSAFVKSFLWRQAVFGRRAWVVDPKGEYGDLAQAWGVRPVALRPGGAIRLNPLDPGPDDDGEAAPDATGRRRMELLSSLASACLGRGLVPRERAALGVALTEATRVTAVPTVPVVVEALLTPSVDAARSLRTEQRDLLEDGRDVALELRRLVYGDLCGMFDGPTTVGLDLSSPLVVLDLSALYSSTALGVLMACATAWLQAALARTASAQRWRFGGGRRPLLPRGRRGVGHPFESRSGALAAVVVEALPRLRGLQRGRAAPGVGLAFRRGVGLRAGGARPRAVVGFGDARGVRAVAGRARSSGGIALPFGHRDGSPPAAPAGDRLVEGRSAILPGTAPAQRDGAEHGRHRRRHDRGVGRPWRRFPRRSCRSLSVVRCWPASPSWEMAESL